MRADLTKIQVEMVMLHLRDQFEEDEQLKLDTLEGETDLFELVGKLLDRIEGEDGTIAALSEQIGDRQARKLRATGRKDAYREAVMSLMQCAQLEKLTLPEATLSLRDTAAKLAVNDADAVPEEYSVQSWKPSMDAIKAAFSVDTEELPNWLRVEPAKPSLTIRRK
jgi:hypothetical protein